MNYHRRQAELLENHLAVKTQFIETELDLALTFCEIAIASKNDAKAFRNRQHAEQAYRSAMHFLEEMPTASENRQIQEKIRRLQERFRQLENVTA